MIKRYILHIEFHWGYWPIISFRRTPRPGDRVMDGGEMGTLVPCQTCSTVGYLHQADKPSSAHTWRGSVCLDCEADASWCDNPPPLPAALE